MAERPGIILYYDMIHPLKSLSYEQKGRILEAMMEYGEYGVVPELDGVLAIVWGFLQPKLDLDAKKYRMKVVKASYSSYCAREKRAGRIPVELEQWMAKEGIDEDWCYRQTG